MRLPNMETTLPDKYFSPVPKSISAHSSSSARAFKSPTRTHLNRSVWEQEVFLTRATRPRRDVTNQAKDSAVTFHQLQAKVGVITKVENTEDVLFRDKHASACTSTHSRQRPLFKQTLTVTSPCCVLFLPILLIFADWQSSCL